MVEPGGGEGVGLGAALPPGEGSDHAQFLKWAAYMIRATGWVREPGDVFNSRETQKMYDNGELRWVRPGYPKHSWSEDEADI